MAIIALPCTWASPAQLTLMAGLPSRMGWSENGGGGREEKERREGERRDVCLNVYEGLMHISTSVLFFVSRKCRFCY